MLILTYTKFAYLEKSKNKYIVDNYLRFYKDLLNGDEACIEEGLKFLTQLLYEHHGERVWVLIDEYDDPSNTAFLQFKVEEQNDKEFNSIIALMKNFLKSSLKDNSFVYKSVITGVLDAGKNSMTSGLNMITIHNVFDSVYSKYYGFSEVEVKDLVEKYNQIFNQKNDLKLSIEDLKLVSNGYNFGMLKGVFNPWSLVQFINFYQIPKRISELDPWVHGGSLNLIESSIGKCTLEPEDFSSISKEFNITIVEEISYDNILIGERNTILNVLLWTGYLTLTDQNNILRIPNVKIQKYLFNQFSIIKYKFLKEIIPSYYLKYFVDGDIKGFFESIKKLIGNYVSYHDIRNKKLFKVDPLNISENDEKKLEFLRIKENTYQVILVFIFANLVSTDVIFKTQVEG